MQFAAVVVIYNMFCSDSPTCQALKNAGIRELSVLIYDNSTKELGNRAYCDASGWTYLGGNGNAGLSKAYNACIDHLQEQGFEGLICLFDDDTQVTPAYFSTLAQAAQSGGQLFVPLIYSDGRLLSPSRLTPRYKTVPFSDADGAMAYTGTDMTAINSGMAMDMSLFRDYRYDENIFLDGIDHVHIQKMVQRGIRPVPIAVRFDHAFSGDEHPAKSAALTRFRIFAQDYRYIFQNRRHCYWYLVGKRALLLTMHYRSLAFLKILCKNN